MNHPGPWFAIAFAALAVASILALNHYRMRPALQQAEPSHAGADATTWPTALHRMNETLHGAGSQQDDEFDPLSAEWCRPDVLEPALLFDQLADKMGVRFVELDPLSYDYPVYRDNMVPALLAVEVLQDLGTDSERQWPSLVTREWPTVQTLQLTR